MSSVLQQPELIEGTPMTSAPSLPPTQSLQPIRQQSVVEYAVSSGAPVSEVRALVELQIQMDKHKLEMRRHDDERERELRLESARNEFAKAMAAFKAEQVRVLRNKKITDGPLKGKYHADLYAVTDAATEALSKHGLSATWEPVEDAKDWIKLACRIKHIAGHSEMVSFGGPVDNGPGRNPIQARKSTITYLERITLLLALGLAEQDADDDGNGGPKTSEGAHKSYDQAHFDANFPKWSDVIAKGRKTPADLIAFIEAKGNPLTEAQKASILSVKRADVQDVQPKAKAPTFAEVADRINAAETHADLDALDETIGTVADAQQRSELVASVERRREALPAFD